MKKHLQLVAFLCLLLMGFQLRAQNLYTIGTGTVNNTSTTYPAPYGNWYGGARHQMMILASELQAAGATAGNITSLAFDVATPNPYTGTNPTALANFEIKLGMTTDTSLSAGWNSASMTSVYLNPSFQEVQGWNTHTFSANFFWDGVSNLIVETCFLNLVGSGPNTTYTNNAVHNETTTPFTSVAVFRADNDPTVCSNTSLTNGINRFNRPNMQLNFLAATGTDAAATALVSPTSPITPGTSPVAFKIQNLAANTITSANVGYSVNGGTPVIETFNGSIPLGGNAVHTFATNMTITAGPNPQIKVWVTNANGSPDLNPGNDTLTQTLCLALPGGTYTVGAGGNYATIQDAVNAVSCGGVAGTVTFSILPGTYYGSYTLANVPGLSNTNSITFTTSSGSANSVYLYADSSSSATNRDIFRIKGSNYINFVNLNFVRTGQGNAPVVLSYSNGSSNSSINGCVFTDNSSNGFNFNAIAANGSNISIDNNTFSGFYNPISLSANGSINGNANLVTNNTFNNFRNYGIYLTGQESATINGNNLTLSSVTAQAFIRTERCAASVISSNIIKGSNANYGLYLSDMNNLNGQANQVFNNSIKFSSNSAAPNGIYVDSRYDTLTTANHNPKDNLEIMFNTAYVTASAGTAFGSNGVLSIRTQFGTFDSYSFDNLKIQSNVFVGAKAGNTPISGNNWVACYVSDTALLFGAVNRNNDYFLMNQSGAPLFVTPISGTATPFATIADWNAATAQEASSVSANPIFSPSLLVPSSITLNNAGNPVSYVTTDITGATRGVQPDMGAYEFNVSPNDVGVIEVVRPVTGCSLSTTDTVVVKVYNYGSVASNSVSLGYRVNGGAVVTGTFNGTFNPGDTITYTFPTTVNLSVPNNYSISAFATTAGDINASNDSSSSTVVSIPSISTFPYFQNFDSGNGGWTSGGDFSSWALGTPAGTIINTAASGSNSWKTNLTGFYNNSENSYVKSPCFNLSTITNPKLSMKVWWNSEGSWDGTNVQYSLDGGVTWTTLGTTTSGIQNWYTAASVNSSNQQPVWVNTTGNSGSGGWVTAEHSLAALQGQSQVIFRVHFTSDGSVNNFDGFAFDDFKIFQPLNPVITSYTQLNDTCSVMARTVKATITHFAGIQVAEVKYNLAGSQSGPFSSAPMTYNSANNEWTGTIPGGTAGVKTYYYVHVMDSIQLEDSTATKSYTNAYLSVNAGPDQTIQSGQSATLSAGSGASGLVISELMFNRGGTGTQSTFPTGIPTSGFADMVEITNTSASPVNLAGIKMVVLNANTTFIDYALPSISLPPSAVMVIVGGTGTDDPANRVYFANNANADFTSSGASTGYYLRDTIANNTVDAVAYNTFTWPASCPVTTADFSGTVGPTAGFSGIQRQGNDSNTSADWTINSATANSTMLTLNPNLNVAPGTYTWTIMGGSVVGNTASITVSPTVTTSYIVTLSDTRCSVSDTVVVNVNGVAQNFDASTTTITSPGSPVQSGSNNIVRAWIKNMGNQVLNTVPVGYRVNNGTPVTQTVNGPLNPGDSVQVTFATPWIPAAAGSYTLKVYTAVPNDVNITNDTASKSITVQSKDGGIARITNPLNGSTVNTPTTISAIVKNYGSMPISNFDIAYSVNGSVIATQTITSTINAGDSISFSFTSQWNPGSGGVKNIKVYVTGLSGDVNATNDTARATVNSTVSVENINGSLIGNVYPNPASDQVFIEMNLVSSGSRLEVMDAQGRIVKNMTLNQNAGFIRETLSVGDLSAGIYTLKVYSGNDVKTANLIIKR